ncbi:EthD family reductase [Lichenibacterium minor]|uniref:EthD family reductase n=1 Tax=Lichenibacterium minor TaxID=2316528 RepID=A0A4Q2U9J5_9HYPH|nr:EthD family reductase [Lichenibacterium minor]RYC33210.1 EthD family reductase [Lichenibacterium minor]
MAATVTVLYPNQADATFDMDYYLGRHMPLVMERFGAHGMTGWKVVKFDGPPERTPFSVMATLAFGSVEGIRAALKAEGGPIIGDVPNFSNKDAMLMFGDDVSHG